MKRLLNIQAVANKTNRGRSTIYKDIAENKFPTQIKIGRSSSWVEDEIDQWIEQRILENRQNAA